MFAKSKLEVLMKYLGMRFGRVLTLILTIGLSAFGLITNEAYATITGPTIGEVASTVTSTFSQLALFITAGAYIAGLGFALIAILKFKQHKDNPQQVTIGTPIALLFIGAALIFMPTVFHMAGVTLFGSSAELGGVSGVTQ